jgi:TatD DNase family protein
MNLTDSHTHLDSEDFNHDRDACIARALNAGVRRMLTIGTGGGLAGAQRAIALAEEHPFIWASVGVHPHDAAHTVDPTLFETLARHPKVVAIGETGLDFYRDWCPKEKQYEMFDLQIELAKMVKKPLIIHSRSAGEECLSMLTTKGADVVGGVFHCFAENAEFAKRLWDIGFYVSFPGLLTFKKAEEVRAICAAIPLEQILIETDAPFLAPEPHRGKRCEPAFVAETAKRLAALKGLSTEEVAEITTNNTLKLFSTMR